MEKPFDLKVVDAKQELSSVINKSKLPITVVNLILKDLLLETNMYEDQWIERQQSDYDRMLAEEQKEKKEGAEDCASSE